MILKVHEPNIGGMAFPDTVRVNKMGVHNLQEPRRSCRPELHTTSKEGPKAARLGSLTLVVRPLYLNDRVWEAQRFSLLLDYAVRMCLHGRSPQVHTSVSKAQLSVTLPG